MNIIINATATKFGGALSILQQFLDSINEFDKNAKNKYYIFCGAEKLKINDSRILIFKKATNTWIDRILWDGYMIKDFLNKKNIFADLIISFQNTGINYYKNTPQWVYYHQPIALFDHKWIFFKSSERSYYLYKHFYPIIVKISLSKVSKVFVQLSFVKRKFTELYKFDSDNIYIIRPNIPKIDYQFSNIHLLNKEYFHIIYPATSYLHKNHIEIVNALNYIKINYPNLINKIKVHLTGCVKNTNLNFVKKINLFGLNKNFIFEGTIQVEQLNYLYLNCNLLVFPSIIETFGLPLIEAAQIGLPIITSDLEYSREVLNGYNGAKFLRNNNPKIWADTIIFQVKNKELKYTPITNNQESSEWGKLFYLISQLSNTKLEK